MYFNKVTFRRKLRHYVICEIRRKYLEKYSADSGRSR